MGSFAVCVEVDALRSALAGSRRVAKFSLSVQFDSELAGENSIGDSVWASLIGGGTKYPSRAERGALVFGFVCSGTRGGLGLPFSRKSSCSLGGVLNGEIRSSPRSEAELGASESETCRVGIEVGLLKTRGLPARFIGGGTWDVERTRFDKSCVGDGGFWGSVVVTCG